MRPPCPPFSPCWCEQNPTNPRCSEALPISIDALSITIAILIVFITFKIIKKNETNNRSY